MGKAPSFALAKATGAGLIGAVIALGLGATGALAQTPVPPAKDFAAAAAQSDQYEIVAAEDALAQSRSQSVRAFAQRMLDDHTRTSAALRQATSASALPIPPEAMSSDQAAMLSALQSQRGSDFDQAYARQQVLAHAQALAVESNYAMAGTDPNLRSLAQSGALLIQHHLEMARQLRESLGGV